MNRVSREQSWGAHEGGAQPSGVARILRYVGIRHPAIFTADSVCLSILLLLTVLAIFAQALFPAGPFEQDLAWRLQPPGWVGKGGPLFILGTDDLGRDVLARIAFGARISLYVSVLSVAIGATLGSTLGMLAAYFGNLLDEGISALADFQLAFPFMLLVIAVIAVLGPSANHLGLLIGLLGISGWMTYARVCRGLVLSLRQREFVSAARALGGADSHILTRHILPNVLPIIVVIMPMDLARIILLESTLSFLGLGVQPPIPSWGGMLAEGRQYLDSAWWVCTFPGSAIMLTVVAMGHFGDRFREALH